MPSRVEVPYHGEFKTEKTEESIFRVLSKVEEFTPKHLPGLESLNSDGQGIYHWKFEELRYQSYSIRIEILTKILMKPFTDIQFIPIQREDVGTARGGWKITKSEKVSAVSFDLELELLLPIPRIFGAMAGPVARAELHKIFNQYLKNVENSFR